MLGRMKNLDQTRRQFMAHCAGAGLGATLAPGILWARMQDAGVSRVNLAMVTEALKLSGIDLTEEERTGLVEGANRNLAGYEEIRNLHIPADISPSFHFSPVVQGMTVNKAKQPFRLSAAPAVKRPANLEDAAFWPVRHLAELIRTRQVTSLELTEMYLARLHRDNPLLNNVVTFLDDYGRAEAKRADAEMAAGERVVGRSFVGHCRRRYRVWHRHGNQRLDSQSGGALRPRRPAADFRPGHPRRRPHRRSHNVRSRRRSATSAWRTQQAIRRSTCRMASPILAARPMP